MTVAREFMSDADDVGGLACVAGIEDATKFLIGLEEGVGLVDEERGPSFLDDAEERGGTDVGSDDGTINQFAEDAEQCALAAAFLRGAEADVGAHVAQLEGVGVQRPQGECFRGHGREDDVAFEGGPYVIEKAGTIDGLGPWLGVFQAQTSIGLETERRQVEVRFVRGVAGKPLRAARD